MPPDVTTPEIRRYLLGTLDEASAAALEARYFADPALADDIGETEQDLVDDYLDGRLDAGERVRFETHYLASPVHRDRVATARALARRLAAQAAPAQASGHPGVVVDFQAKRTKRPIPASFYGWLAFAAALVIASLWSLGGPGPVSRQAAAPPTPARQEPPAPGVPGSAAAPAPAPGTAPSAPATSPAPAPAPGPARALLAITLSPIVTRGESPDPHRLPAGPADVVIHLQGVPAATDRAYVGEIQTVDGRTVWEGRARAGAADRGVLATIRVPADRLAADDYVVVLAATTDAGREERGRYVLRLR